MPKTKPQVVIKNKDDMIVISLSINDRTIHWPLSAKEFNEMDKQIYIANIIGLSNQLYESYLGH